MTQLHLFTERKAARVPAALEVKVHIALADTLKLSLTPGWLWFHYPSGGLRNAVTGALLKRMGTLAGVSDFLLVAPPHATLHALELKRRGRKPTPAQMSFLALVRLCGGKSDWADSYDDAIRILRAWGAVRVSP